MADMKCNRGKGFREKEDRSREGLNDNRNKQEATGGINQSQAERAWHHSHNGQQHTGEEASDQQTNETEDEKRHFLPSTTRVSEES